VFIAADVAHLEAPGASSGTVDAILQDLQARYPGERTLETRRQSMEQGIPVDPSIFELVCRL
jgi:LDH2 family malate/lactate/ureidoglycolate dehydrogenase